jgi:hypothetical protein
MTDTTRTHDLASGRPDPPGPSLADLPLMLTVDEAAHLLRISRTSAYKLAHEWRCTAGASGLPTVRLGSRIMVRRVDLAAIVVPQPDRLIASLVLTTVHTAVVGSPGV